MRESLTTNQIIEIKTENATVFNLALLSGEITYRLGDVNFTASDDKLNENVRTDSIPIGGPTSVFIKAAVTSEIQYRRE